MPNKKLTALTALTTPTSTDVIYLVRPSTGAYYKCLLGNLSLGIGWVDVRAYGALPGIGNAATNRVAIQSAIDSLKTTGGVVFFPELYYVDDTVKSELVCSLTLWAASTSEYNNITLRGLGQHTGIKHSLDGGDLSGPYGQGMGFIGVFGSENYGIKNFAIENMRVSGYSANDQVRLVTITKTEDMRFSNAWFDTNKSEGIVGYGDQYSKKVIVEGCRFYDIGRGYVLGAINIAASHIRISNNYIEYCGQGIEEGSDSIIIIGNHFKDITGFGAMIMSANAQNNDQNIVMGNTFDNVSSTALYISDIAHNTGKITVIGNTFKKCLWCINAGSISPNGVIIQGNYFEDCPTEGTYAILIQQGRATIEGNTFVLGGTAKWTGVIRCYGNESGVDDYHVIRNNTFHGDLAVSFGISTGYKTHISGNYFPGDEGLFARYSFFANSRWFIPPDYPYIGSPEITFSPKYRSVLIHTATPTVGTWKKGDVIINPETAAGGTPEWRCTTSGTFSTAEDTTGDTDGSTATITGMTDTSDFCEGDFVSVSAGFPTTGPYRILSKTASTITLDTNSDSAQSNITVSTPDPIFKAMANLAA